MTDYNSVFQDGWPHLILADVDNSNQTLNVGVPPGGGGIFISGVANDGQLCYFPGSAGGNASLYSTPYKGGVYGAFTNKPGFGARSLNGTQNWSSCYDGQYLYCLCGHDLYIYDPLLDTVAATFPGFDNTEGTLLWDGDRTVYSFTKPSNYTIGPDLYSRIDTQTRVAHTGLALTQYLGAGNDVLCAVFASGGTVYRLAFGKANSHLSIGMCQEGAGPSFGLPFVYANDVASPFTTPAPPKFVGFLLATGRFFAGNGQGVASYIDFDLVTGNITNTTASPISPGGGGCFGMAVFYNFVATAALYEADGVTPVPNGYLLNAQPSAAGFPSIATRFQVKALVTAAHLVCAPVSGSGAIVNYIQVSNSPTGPWLSSVDLGPVLAGFYVDLYVRGYPPAGFTSLSNVPFSVRITAA